MYKKSEKEEEINLEIHVLLGKHKLFTKLKVVIIYSSFIFFKLINY